MRKYEVTMDYVMTATIVVEARDAESAERKAGRYVHTRRGFDEYVRAAAPSNVLWDDPSCCGSDGFDIPVDATEFDGRRTEGAVVYLTKKEA